jgi:hypothetical protein
MDFDAVAHCQGHRAVVDATLVPANAVTVPKAVTGRTFTFGFQLSL